MKFCKNCGGMAEDNDIYCGYCGSKLQQDAPKVDESGKSDFVDEDGLNEGGFSEFDSNFHEEFSNEFGNIDEKNNVDSNGHKQLLPNKIANDANTFGILALIFGILGGVLGIVFGVVGLIKVKKALALCSTGEYDGKPKASNGKILSIIGIVLGAIGILIYIL